MTRILCVTSMYPPQHDGGYEISCRDVMVRLAERGHRVTVLASTRAFPGVVTPAGEGDANPAVQRRLTLYFRDGDLWKPPPWTRWQVERRNRRAVLDAIATSRPEVAAVWHVGALSLGVVTTLVEAGIPVVYAVCDDWLTYAPLLDQWTHMLRRLGPLAPALRPLAGVPTVPPDIGASGEICFVSQRTRQRAEEHWSRPYPRATVVYSGINRTLFTPRPAAPPWGWRLLYAGRLDPRKGPATAVRALAHLPEEATLEIRGAVHAAERSAVEALAAEIAHRLTFGTATQAELADRYRAADTVVFPSQWEEPFGLVPIEAMACGVPVVATGTGGSDEFLVDGWNCARFPAGDPEALAAAVRRLAADPGLRERVVDGGLRTAEFFDIERLTDTFEGWYEAAAHPGTAPPPERRFDLAAEVDGDRTGLDG
jgi:glycogen synthase